MYNDNCKTVPTANGGFDAATAPIEPMKDVILELHDAMVKARVMSGDIYGKLFGPTQMVSGDNLNKVNCAYDALCDIRRITKDVLETLYDINQKIEG